MSCPISPASNVDLPVPVGPMHQMCRSRSLVARANGRSDIEAYVLIATIAPLVGSAIGGGSCRALLSGKPGSASSPSGNPSSPANSRVFKIMGQAVIGSVKLASRSTTSHDGSDRRISLTPGAFSPRRQAHTQPNSCHTLARFGALTPRRTTACRSGSCCLSRAARRASLSAVGPSPRSRSSTVPALPRDETGAGSAAPTKIHCRVTCSPGSRGARAASKAALARSARSCASGRLRFDNRPSAATLTLGRVAK